MINTNRVEFIKSAASSRDFIRDTLPRVAFAGKSNVGKSSLLNRLLNRKNLARVGSAPGKTVHVNYFKIDGRLYFVDLPGYGYAAVSKAERDRWGELMESFFAEPEQLTLGVLIVDARHAPTADDVTMADWFKASGRPFVAAANKTDKVKKSELSGKLERIRSVLDLPDTVALIPASAEKGDGKAALWAEIEKYL